MMMRTIPSFFKLPFLLLLGCLALSIVGVVLSSGAIQGEQWPIYGVTYVVGVSLFAIFIGPFIIFAHYLSRRCHLRSYGHVLHVLMSCLYLTFILLVAILLIHPALSIGYSGLWAIWMGVFLLFLLCPAFLMEVRLFIAWFSHRPNLLNETDLNPSASGHPTLALPPSLLTRSVALVTVLVMSMIMLLLVTLLPTHWNNPLRGYYTSQSSPLAVFNLQINSDDTDPYFLKLFPDQLMYWVWCYVILVTSFVLLCIPKARKVLYFPYRFNLVVTRCRFTLGELLISASFFGLVAWWTWYWSTGYVDPEGREIGRIGQLSELERTARTLGHLNNLFISFLLFPITRNSIWQFIFGISYERALRFHRFIGVLTVLSTSLHMWVWWAYWSNLGQFLDQFRIHPNVIASPCDITNTCHTGNFLLPILFATWLILVAIFITALEYVRRSWYELFYYVHQLTWIYLIVGLIHAWSLWNYFIFGGLLYLIDKVIRHLRSVQPFKLVSLHRTTDELHSHLVVTPAVAGSFNYAAGQFAWINIPSISSFEWHPFSIVYSPEGFLTFVIKAISFPQETWTSRLLELASSTAPGDSHSEQYIPLILGADPRLEVYIDGPYGELTINPANYETVVLIAGGIGITPIFSLFMDLAHRSPSRLRNCILYWTAQTSGLFDTFLPQMEHICQYNDNFSIRLFATQQLTSTALEFPQGHKSTKILAGRVDFDEEFANIANFDGEVGVFACGPNPMLSKIQDIASDHHFDVHTETFAL